MMGFNKPNELTADAAKGHVIRHVEVFDPDSDSPQWECPFCEPPVFTLPRPSKDNQFAFDSLRVRISRHLAIHRNDVLKAINNSSKHTKRNIEESLKRTNIWIDGTIADRGLYK